MLASAAFILQGANVGLLTLGGLGCVGVLVWLARRGRWRNPLAGVPLPADGPPLTTVLIVPMVYIAVQYVVLRLLVPDMPADGQAEPGTGVWQRFQLADGVAKVLASVLMAVMLVISRRAGAKPRVSLLKGTAVGILGLLVVLPITTAQLEMGRVIWNWLHPGTQPPLHAVLQGLARNAWDAWGVAQLLVGAILIAPVAEELFFRGIILQSIAFHSRRVWPAIALSSIAFGVVHAQPQDVVPLVTMGVVLGYLRIRCGSLWPCIVLHMLFNARTMLTAVLAPELLQQG